MKIGIIACGAIVRELCTIAQRQAWDFELTAIPAQLHNRPEKIAPAVKRKLDGWAERFDLILVGYADCGTGGALDALVRRYPHAVRIPGPHCYEFYGGDLFHEQTERELGTFYLTDFLARHFDGLVWKGLGLDRHPALLDLYFGNYRELLYLQQLPQQDESERARRAADALGLRYRHAVTGLDELEERLLQIIAERKASMAQQICPTCESPLTTDAVREGQCQCCGSALPAPTDEPVESSEDAPAASTSTSTEKEG